MYAAIIFAALISSTTAWGISAFHLFNEGSEVSPKVAYRFQVVDDAQLQKLVNEATTSIDRIAKSNWSAKQKLTAIHQIQEKVKVYRAKSWSRNPATELGLDMMINPYQSFPQANTFRKDQCKTYQSTLKVDWEPSTEGAPTASGVKRAWDNLKAICAS